jgi:hypothetical protein
MYTAPVFSGFLLKLFAWILENKVIGLLALNYLKKNNLITKVKDLGLQEINTGSKVPGRFDVSLLMHVKYIHFGQFFTKTQYNEPPMNIPRFPIKGGKDFYSNSLPYFVLEKTHNFEDCNGLFSFSFQLWRNLM